MSAEPADSLAIGDRWLRIDSRRPWFPDLGAVFRYRQLLLLLCRRNITILYRQTVLGSVWLVVSPIVSAGLLSFVFGRVAHLSSGGVPYFAFTFAGLLAWNLFSSSVTGAAGSLLSNSTLFTRIYFPRLLLPLSSLAPVLLNAGISCIVMFFLLVAYKIGFSYRLLLLPFWLGLALLLSVGVSLMLSSLAVLRRDVQYATQAVIPLLLFLTPVAYSVAERSRSASDDLSSQSIGNHRGGLSMVIGRKDSPRDRFDVGCRVHHRHNIPYTDCGVGRLRTPRMEVCRCRLTRRSASVTYRRYTPWV